MNFHLFGKLAVVLSVVIALGTIGVLVLSPNGDNLSEQSTEDTYRAVTATKISSSIEHKAKGADAVIVGTVKNISNVFELPDPDVPEFPNETWPFRDVTVIVDRIVAGKESIETYGGKEIKVRLLAEEGSEKWFTEGERYLLILRNPCVDCLYGSDAFIVLGDQDGRFLLKNGKASNQKEGEMTESELTQRIIEARK